MSANRPIETPERRRAVLERAPALLVSLLWHMVLVIILGMITLTIDSSHGVLDLFVRAGEDAGDGPAVEIAAAQDLNAFDLESSAASAPEDRIFDELARPQDGLEFDLNASALRSAGGQFGEGNGEAGSGKDAGGGSSFFGLGGVGKSFVYVIDCSGSMNDHGKFERAMKELIRSISDLDRGQRFFVILYNDNAYPMDADEPAPATRENVEMLQSWLSGFSPEGGTYPLEALKYAIGLAPDAIYFLTDGKFDPVTITALRNSNGEGKKKVPIHTIAFVRRESEGLLKKIARNSGGKYRFVK